jgi:hypothetical protein
MILLVDYWDLSGDAMYITRLSRREMRRVEASENPKKEREAW